MALPPAPPNPPPADSDVMAALPPGIDDGVTLRPMTADDLPAAQALTDQLRWPHRLSDWQDAFAHAEGRVAERDGQVVGTGLRLCYGSRHAVIGLVIVAPACQGRRIGLRLMLALLDGLDAHTVLLHATPQGRGLYERLGFVRTGEVRQHQGTALPAPLVALAAGRRLRPAGVRDVDTLIALDHASRGMPREALIRALAAQAVACVVLSDGEQACGFAMLRRFGRGQVIGPVVAPDVDGAQALIAHLAGQNAGHFTRIDIDFDSGLAEWLEGLGLLRVDAPVTMVRPPRDGAPSPSSTTEGTTADTPQDAGQAAVTAPAPGCGRPRTWALVSQALA
jgi:ribosomal protein S18 acetylase RimI-like enzyme